MSKDIKKPVGETRRYIGIDLGDKRAASASWTNGERSYYKNVRRRPCLSGFATKRKWTSRWRWVRIRDGPAICWGGAATKWWWLTHDNLGSLPRAMPRVTNGMRGHWRSYCGRIGVCCPPSNIEPKNYRWI